jgi:hypothetical protein
VRWLLLLIGIVLLVCTTSALQAASPQRGSQSALARLVIAQTASDIAHVGGHVSLAQTMRHVRQLSGRSPGRLLSPRRAAHAPSAASASDLALPSDVISAGKGTQGPVGSGAGPFSSYHHSWSGFQAGVAAVFDFQPVMTLSYQGSIFSDAGSAGAYMTDSFNLTSSKSPISPVSCSDIAGVPCEITGFPVSSSELAFYTVAQVNYCVIEVGYQGDAALIDQNLTDVSKVTAGIFVLGIDQAKNACVGSASSPPTPTATAIPTATATPTVTPTASATPTVQTVFVVDGVSVHTGSKPDSSVKHTVKAKKQVYVFIKWTLTSAPSNAQPAYLFSVRRGGKVMLEHSAAGNESSYAPGAYYVSWPIKLRKLGTYVVTGTVTLTGQAQQGTTTLKVVK